MFSNMLWLMMMVLVVESITFAVTSCISVTLVCLQLRKLFGPLRQ